MLPIHILEGIFYATYSYFERHFFYATYSYFERHFFMLPRCKVFTMMQQIQIRVKKNLTNMFSYSCIFYTQDQNLDS